MVPPEDQSHKPSQLNWEARGSRLFASHRIRRDSSGLAEGQGAGAHDHGGAQLVAILPVQVLHRRHQGLDVRTRGNRGKKKRKKEERKNASRETDPSQGISLS